VREAQVLRRAAELKSALLESLSHALKTPLTAVTIAANNLNAAALTAKSARSKPASFARSWTMDLKARRIRVNVLSPGPIQTPGFDVFADKDVKAYMQSLVPLDRLGTVDDVANAALYLASDDSSYVAGIELFVDGGAAQV